MSSKNELIELFRTRALLKGPIVKLASGKSSDVYVDCKRVTLHGPSLLKLSKILVEELKGLDPKPDCIAGVSVGGDPLVAGAVMCAAERHNWELEALLVRKESKKHGASSGRCVDGVLADSSKNVWLVEDVVSTGGSSLLAARNLIAENYKVSGILCLIDREMGGLESLHTELKIPVRSLLKLSDLLA